MNKVLRGPKSNIFLVFSVSLMITGYAKAAQVDSASFQDGVLSLSVSYQGDSLAHNFSVELDATCDANNDIAGRLIDSGWNDTDLNETKTKSVSVNLSFPCDAKNLYLFADGRQRTLVPLK